MELDAVLFEAEERSMTLRVEEWVTIIQVLELYSGRPALPVEVEVSDRVQSRIFAQIRSQIKGHNQANGDEMNLHRVGDDETIVTTFTNSDGNVQIVTEGPGARCLECGWPERHRIISMRGESAEVIADGCVSCKTSHQVQGDRSNDG